MIDKLSELEDNNLAIKINQRFPVLFFLQMTMVTILQKFSFLFFRLLSELSPTRGLRAVVRETGSQQLLEVRTMDQNHPQEDKCFNISISCCLCLFLFRSGTVMASGKA